MNAPALPNGWESVEIRDIIDVHYGKGLPKSKRDEQGRIAVFGSNGIVGAHTKALVEGPCIIIGRKGAAGAVKISRHPCWPIDTTYYTHPHRELSLEFTYYALAFLNLGSLDRSTAIPGLNRDDLYAQTIALPPSSEQRRIANAIETHLSRVDAGVAALKNLQIKLRRYRAAVLKAACEGALLPPEEVQAIRESPAYEPAEQLLQRILAERRKRWEAEQIARGKNPARLKYKQPRPPDTENLPPLPAGWVWATVEQLVKVQTGATPLRSKPGFYDEGTIPWVRSEAVNRPFIDSAHEFITDLAIKETTTKLFPPGTLVMAMYGEGKTRAKVSELRIEAATNQALAALLFDDQTSLCRPFIKLSLQSNYEDVRRLSSGGVQPNLNLTLIRRICVPFAPLNEQDRIVTQVARRLSVLDEVSVAINATVQRAERLRQSILKEAFAGRLVPQDPDDEPASELLKRIQAGREQRAAMKRRE
jgi:type I restriction enzyme S subunit